MLVNLKLAQAGSQDPQCEGGLVDSGARGGARLEVGRSLARTWDVADGSVTTIVVELAREGPVRGDILEASWVDTCIALFLLDACLTETTEANGGAQRSKYTQRGRTCLDHRVLLLTAFARAAGTLAVVEALRVVV